MKNFTRIMCLIFILVLTSAHSQTYISVSPREAVVEPDAKIPFMVGLVKDGEVQQVLPWDFQFTAKEGSISGSVYNAPSEPGTYIILVRYKKIQAIAMITVKGQDEVAKIEVLPKEIEIEVGQSCTFTSKVYGKSGELMPFVPAWGAKGGQIETDGKFTAGDKPGSYDVVAWGPGGIKTSVSIKITLPSELTRINIVTSEKSIYPGEQITFQAQGYDQREKVFLTEIRWKAQGGTITSQGVFTAGEEAGQFLIEASDFSGQITASISIEIKPAPAQLTKIEIISSTKTLYPGQSILLQTRSFDQYGKIFPHSVFWLAQGGQINKEGNYVAGEKIGTYSVEARDSSGRIVGSISLQIVPIPKVLTRVVISSPQEEIYLGESIQLKVLGYDQENQPMPISVKWQSNIGQVDSQGVFSSPNRTGLAVITANETTKNITGQTQVRIIPLPPEAKNLQIITKQRELSPGEKIQLQALILDQYKKTFSAQVEWKTSKGKISPTGEFTAGEQPGTVSITASLVGSDIQTTVELEVIAKAVAISHVAISPKEKTLAPGEKILFSALVYDEKGHVLSTGFQWTATGGEIDQKGEFIAGEKEGEFQVTVASSLGEQAQAKVTITAPKVPSYSITRLEVNPGEVNIFSTKETKFTVNAYDASGKIVDSPEVAWEASGGTIDQQGKFIAGEIPGDYQVIVKHIGSEIRSQAMIKIQSDTLYHLVIKPAQAEVKPGGKIRFESRLYRGENEVWTWPWDISYLADQGKLEDNVFTAPETPGTYKIKIRHSKAVAQAIVKVISPENSVSPPFTIVKLEPEKSSYTLEPGESIQFQVQAFDTQGKKQNTKLLWKAQGGIIDSSGKYTAGKKVGSYKVLAHEPKAKITQKISVKIEAKESGADHKIRVKPSRLVLAPNEKKEILFKLYRGNFEVWTWPWEFDFETNGGSFTNNTYTAPEKPGTYSIIIKHKKASRKISVEVSTPPVYKIFISPQQITLKQGQKHSFKARAFSKSGKEVFSELIWECSGGTIDQEGLYTAGNGPGKFLVQVRSKNSKAVAQSKIQIAKSALIKIQLIPENPVVETGETIRFKLEVQRGTKKLLVWPWDLKCESLLGTFRKTDYTAPNRAGTDEVTIYYQDQVLKTKVKIVPKSIAITSLKIEPSQIAIGPLQRQEFKVKAFNKEGGEISNLQVNWQATGGNINKNGLYIAKDIPGDFEVTVREASSQKTATAKISILQAFSQVVVQPENIVLRVNQQYQFKAFGKREGDKLQEIPVQWNARVGNINRDGLFQAGQTTGKDFVIEARDVKTGLKGYARIGISNFDPKEFVITPEKIVLAPREKQKFEVIAYDEHRNAIPVNLVWFAKGGSIDQEGLFVAGGKKGDFSVTVVEKGSNIFLQVPVSIQEKENIVQEPTAKKGYSLKINVEKTEVNPGDKVKINPSLFRNGLPVYTWAWEFTYRASEGSFTGRKNDIWVAPSQPGVYSVKVYHQDAFNSIEIKVKESTISRLEILPQQVTLSPGETKKFTIKAYDSKNKSCSCSVQWNAQGGTISKEGIYEAGKKAGRFFLTASSGDITTKAEIEIRGSVFSRNLGKKSAQALRSGVASRKEIRHFISSNIFKKPSFELEQFIQGFVDVYGAAGRYQMEEFLCDIASEFGKKYGHDLSWGYATNKDVIRFIREYILRLPNSCHHSFKRGFLNGYKDYEGVFVYEKIWRRVFEKK